MVEAATYGGVGLADLDSPNLFFELLLKVVMKTK